MPRKSAASLSVVRVDGRPNRLSPPDDLDADPRRLWVELVGANRPQHFKASDAPLLRQYCEQIVLAERAAHEMQAAGGPVLPDGRMSPWFAVQQRAVRTMGVLANRLRLAPSARGGAKEAGRAAAGHQPSYYERMEGAE
jgi:phage terminase small subunit